MKLTAYTKTHITTQVAMTVVGAMGSTIAFKLYHALDSLTPLLDDYCPYIYKYLPRLPRIRKLFDRVRIGVVESIRWLELNLRDDREGPTQNNTAAIRDLINFSKSSASDINEAIGVLRYADKLKVIRSYCDDGFRSDLKIISFTAGAFSAAVTAFNFLLNAYLLYSQRKNVPLLGETPSPFQMV